jgi:hypothetical protein
VKNQTAATRKPLYLSEDEAFALLDMCLLTEAQDDPLKSQAVDQLAGLCRGFLRRDDEIPNQEEGLSPAYRLGVLSRLIQRSEALAG